MTDPLRKWASPSNHLPLQTASLQHAYSQLQSRVQRNRLICIYIGKRSIMTRQPAPHLFIVGNWKRPTAPSHWQTRRALCSESTWKYTILSQSFYEQWDDKSLSSTAAKIIKRSYAVKNSVHKNRCWGRGARWLPKAEIFYVLRIYYINNN